MRDEYDAGEYLAKHADQLAKEKAEWAKVLASKHRKITKAKRKSLLQFILSLFK
jgi:hypothetical protein